MKKGLIMVNTGDGKGKTTAALGLALRAAGHNFKICIIQFIKGSWTYGEMGALKRFEDVIDFHVTGQGFTWKSKDLEKDKKLARKGWDLARQCIAGDAYDLVVLDELTYLMSYGIVETADVLAALQEKPERLHVLITGRNAPDELVAMSDLVTEMKLVKHPFDAGVKAQKGIEF